ncbi:MAG: ECF transporter S component [Ruminococcaceae bacterium]|nr:ECF transporter S component [Oscillospiraceae bacterium]
MTKLNVKQKTEKMVLGAIFTALVVVLQLMGSFIRFGPFSVSLVLVPIVIGAALCGTKIGAWLGFVFGVTVLLSGDAAPFFAIDVLGTVLTVLLKGTLCGLCAGAVYSFFKNRNIYLAVILSAIICPIVNTGVFFLGCVAFFLETIVAWGAAEGFKNAATYMFIGLAGGNFIFELLSNIILAPVILRIISAVKKQ